MSWFTALVVYVLIWWTTLFAILPLGTKPTAEPDQSTGWRGVPERPAMIQKIAITTLVSIVLWFVVWSLINSNQLSFRHGILAMPNNYPEK